MNPREGKKGTEVRTGSPPITFRVRKESLDNVDWRDQSRKSLERTEGQPPYGQENHP